MKITRFTLIVLATLALVLTSCQESGEEPFDGALLRLQLTSPRFSHRALIPTAEALVVDHFIITATGPDNQQLEVSSCEDTVEIGNLLIGWWTIEATAYNSNGVALVAGSVRTLLSRQTTTATVELTDLVGSGTLSVSVSWDIDQVGDDVALEALLFDQGMESVTLQEPSLDKATGTATIGATLPAGSYLLKVQLLSQDVVVSGASEAVRIIDGVTSSGNLELVIGDLSSAYTLTVVNKTGLPIEGSVQTTDESYEAGDTVTMVYEAVSLPEGVSLEELTITWYCEGEEVHTGSNIYVSTPAAGVHRYDVIVNHTTLGSLGSTSLLFSMPLGTKGSQ